MGKIITLENLKEYNKKVQEQIAGSLKEPASGLAVGKYFRVASIDDDGHVVLECVDAPTAPVQSVSAGGQALTPDANGNVNIPKAAYNVFGLISSPLDPHKTGVALASNSMAPMLYVEAITSSLWSSMRNTNPSGMGNSQPIVIGNIDHAVKLAMTDGIGTAWTASEQSAARARMGIVDTVSESYTITTSDWTALSSSSPYTYSTTVTATHIIGNDTTIELINDQPVLFATNGFAIASVSGQVLTIYSIGAPSASVTLEVQYNG